MLGIGLVRLLAPALAGFAGSLAIVVGYLLAIIGIAIIAHATRRKGSKVFRTMENKAKN